VGLSFYLSQTVNSTNLKIKITKRDFSLNLSIKNKLSLTFAGIILTIASVQTWLTSERLQQDADRSTQQLISSLTDANINSIEQWLDGKKAIVEASIEGFNQQAEPIPSLHQAMLAGNFDLVYAGTKAGQVITGKPITFPDNYDPRQRPWYLDAVKANSMTVTSPYVDAASGKLVITMAKPFTAKQNSGVIAGDLSIDALISDILAVKQGGVYATLLSGNGTIIAHPNQAFTLKPTTELSYTLNANTIKQAASSNELITLTIDGIESLVGIKQVPGTDWYFSLVMDKNLAYQHVTDAFTDAIIGVIIQLLLVIGIATLLITRALKPLSALSDAMKDLSQGNGDLTRRLAIEQDDEIGQLGKEVNAFIEKLHASITGISTSSVQLSQQAKTSHDAALMTSNALNVQLNEISQIATAIHEMSATAQEVASHAEQTASAARASNDNCNEGKAVITRNQESITHLANHVQDASAIIKELENNAQGINAILSTIRDIAEQTNLLALNAAIEAARAGDQGRGFAVVADEVRVLSQRTHSSTEEIRSMIETLQRNTHNAVETMQQGQDLANSSVSDANNATNALERITDSIQDISDMATHISSAAEEQRAVSDEISRNVQAVNDVSDQMSTEAAHAQTSSQELNEIAQHLNTEVNKFQI
jgi:methyl-accepting chemotaxis protein